MNISTKFTVATEEGIGALNMLTRQLAIEKYASLVKPEILEHYIRDHYNEKTLVAELNSMSNQWLVVYEDNQPAGYARLTSKGDRPEALQEKRSICLADFGILQSYTNPAIVESLIAKCLSTGLAYEYIWLHEYAQNPLLALFESRGFVRQKESPPLALPLEAVCLVRPG